MSLTELAVRKAVPREKPYFMKDEDGLSLIVWPSGEKTWQLRYWVKDHPDDKKSRERRKTLGPYPLITLKEARERRDEARKSLLDGIDPFAKSAPSVYVFEALALEWWSEHKLILRNAKNIQTMEHRIKSYIIPEFQGRDPKSITSLELLDMVKAIEKTGKVETAHRTLDILRQIFSYIMLQKRLIERNPVLDLRGLIAPRAQVHHPSITEPAGIAELRDKIKNYRGCESIRCAMLFSLYTFARPGEVRVFCNIKV